MPIREKHVRCVCTDCILQRPGGMMLKPHELHGHRARARARQGASSNSVTPHPQAEDPLPNVPVEDPPSNAAAKANIIESLTSHLSASTLIDSDIDMDPNEYSPLWMSRSEYQEARGATRAVPFSVANPQAPSLPSSLDHVILKHRLDHRTTTSLRILENIESEIQAASDRFTQGNLASWDVTLT
jgi:hypothetical protein